MPVSGSRFTISRFGASRFNTLSRGARGGGAPTGPTIDTVGSLDVSTFRIGTEHTISAGTASASGGGTISYEYRWLVGGAEAATTAAYTPQAADDEASIVAQWRAVETGGTNPGATGWQAVGSGTVTYPAPTVTASDSLTDRTLTISVDSIDNGATAALTSLTLDGAGVLGDAAGTGPWTYDVPSAAASQTVAWEITASNTGGTDTATGSEVVAGDLAPPAAPTITATDSLAGRTLTISIDEITGNPTPSTSLSTLTLDGVDVLANAVGSGPWTYDVPSSVSSQAVAWTVTASNAEGADTASGAETVPADLAVPIVTASDALSGRDLTISVDTLAGTPTPSLALVALTLDGVDVLGAETGADPWTYAVPSASVAQTVAWTVEASNSEGTDTASGSEVVAADLTAPTAANSLADQTFNENSGVQTYDTSGDFTGSGLSYALSTNPDPTNITINTSTGVVSVDTDATGLLSAVSVVVEASNLGGSVTSGFNLTVEEAVSSTLAGLFDNGENGAWYDPSDLSTLSQTPGGTLGNVSVGDPVGQMNDKSGNNNHATQSDAAARPVLRQTVDGVYYLEGDQVDDFMSAPVTGFNGIDFFVAAALGEETVNDKPWFGVVSDTDHREYASMRYTADDLSYVYIRNGHAGAAVDGITQNPTILALQYFTSTTSADAYEDGAFVGEIDSSYPTYTSLSDITIIGLKRPNGASIFEGGRFFGGVVVDRELSSAEIDYVQSFLASKLGETAPSFTTQPSLDQAHYNVGDTVTLTEGAAIGNPAPTLSITRFELDGVDKSGELAGLTWDTTGEAAGTISYEVTASNSEGSVVSDTIMATLSIDATAPVINSATWDAATQTLTVNVTEVGPDPDTVDIYVVSYDGAEPSDAQVKAGTGGSIIEAYAAQDTTGFTDQDLGFTTASAGSNNIKVYVEDDEGNSDSTTLAASIEFVPDAFVDADWSVATGASTGGELDVTIANLPAANGSTITDVEYELDASGTWTSSGGTSDFTITGLAASTSYDVRLRAVNGQGAGAASNSETATSSAAASSNLVVDSGFDDFSEWDLNGEGLSITGSKLVLDGSNPGFSNVHSLGGKYMPLGFTADGTETFEFQIECTRLATPAKRVRFAHTCFTGPSAGDPGLGDTIPERLGGSDVTINATGVYGPYSFSVPPGTTHIKLFILFIDGNIDADFDNISVVQV